MTATLRSCPVCDSELRQAGEAWLLRCTGCDFLCSTLTPAIETDHEHSAIDEADRAIALGSLRRANFARILNLLQKAVSGAGSRLLEVGCGHGWFLSAAKERGFAPLGLEPDEAICRLAQQTGLPVRCGYFPQALNSEGPFDVVVFNDVFEHLPDVGTAMEACHKALVPGGVLVINLPVRSGIFYQVASWMKCLGVRKPFDRLWQKGFPSPHLSYFASDHLRRLASRYGMQCEVEAPLPSVQGQGLWQRLRYDRTASPLMAGLVYGGVMLSLPLLRLFSSDIRVFIFRKPHAVPKAA